jgi:hypothetical protein
MVKRLVPHYTPEWKAASDNDPGVALIKVFSHMTETIINRLNQVPQKNFIAFLDMLGIKQLPAQSSRVPVTFIPAKDISEEIFVPERTQVSADKTDVHEELLFETEMNLIATPAQLMEVYGIDPVNDKIYKPPQNFLDLEKKTQDSIRYTIVSLASKDTRAFQLDHVTDLKEQDILKIVDNENTEFVEISKLAATIVEAKDKLEFDHSPDTNVEKITKFNLFDGKNLQEHILYLANKELFNVKGKAQFNIYVTHHSGSETGVQALQFKWQYWGKVKNNGSEEDEDWQDFEMIDGTHGFTMDGEIKLIKQKEGEITEKEIKLAEGEKDEVPIKSRWIRCKLEEPLGNEVVRKLPKLDNIEFTIESQGKNLGPDIAFSKDNPLDISKPFLPFGKEPRIFDNFAIGVKEAFSKKGGKVSLNIKLDPGGSLGPPSAVLFEEYLFRWNNIRGDDEQRFREILLKKYSIEWVKKAKFDEPPQDNKVTLRSTENNTFSISITLNDDKTIATLTTHDGRTDEFIVKNDTVRSIYDRKIRIFFRGYSGKLIEIKTYPDAPDKKSDWIDHGFPPNTSIFASSTPGTVVYHPLNPSTSPESKEKILSIFVRGENGHLIERVFDTKKIQWEWIDWQSPKQYLFNWDRIPGSDNGKLIEFLKKSYGLNWVEKAEIKKTDRYLFSWDNIPGNDNGRLIEFLIQKFDIDWVRTAKIEKIDDGRTIRLTDENNFLSLKLNNEKTKVNLEINNGRTYDFIAKIENDKLNIYTDYNTILISREINRVSLKKENEVKIKVEIDDGRTDDVSLKNENGQWNVYSQKNNVGINSDPAAIYDTAIYDTELSVFAIASDNYLYEFNKKRGDWKCHPKENNQTFDSSPFAVSYKTIDKNIVRVFLKGKDGQLYQLKCKMGDDSENHHQWIGVEPLPAGKKVDSKPFAWVSDDACCVLAYVKGNDNQLWEYDSTAEPSWNAKPHDKGINFDSNPHGYIYAIRPDEGGIQKNIHVFLKGMDNSLYEYNSEKKWDTDHQMPVKLTNSPFVLNENTKKLFIFSDTNQNRILERISPLYLFGWDGIPGIENGRFRYFLSYNYSIDWVKNANIEKTQDEKIINVNYQNNHLSISLNDEKTIATLTIENVITDTFHVKMENGKLNIYSLPGPSWIDHKDPYEQILTPSLSWEYLTEKGWSAFKDVKDETSNFLAEGKIKLKIPDDIVESKIAGKENYWIKAKLTGGNYGEEIFVPDKNITSLADNGASKAFPGFIKTSIKSPIFKEITIDYSFEEKKKPENCITYNNLTYLDETQASKIPNKFFEPFVQMGEKFPGMDEENPSIYLGFNKILRSGPLRIFFAEKELPFTEAGKPVMKWYYNKDMDWNELKGYSDNTEGLIKSGILEFTGPSDFSARTICSKFLFWIKGSLIGGKYEEGYPLLGGIYPNTTFALQAETIREEILGSSDGRPDQIFSFMRLPILEGEEIRVNEVLTDQERQDLIDKFGKDTKIDGKTVEPIVSVKDETDKVIETWILWSEVQTFFDSTKQDRHYTIDRATGKIRFGDGINGMIPAMGENNIKAFSYQTGGGAEGNIEDREIKSLKSAISGIDKVLNPEAADGGAKAATLDQMLEIGPAMISHRNRAVTPQDFEWLAKKASRKIAKVKCLSNTNNQTNTNKEHLKEKGWVTVIIVPDEKTPKPVPSLELRRIVKKYLEDHCANILSGHVWVDGPAYMEISVSVDVFVTSIDLVSVVEREVKRKLDDFFHPLTGGPEGNGWDFGRDVNVSDIYALLGEIDGLDHIENLILDYDAPGKEFLFCWNEISEDNSRLLDYLIKTFDAWWVKTANIVNSDDLKANLFSWDEFLEKDNRLIDFLIQNFNEDWVKVAKIKRYSKDHEEVMMIMLSDSENCISLKLDHKKTKMKVIINKIENDKLIAKRVEEFITKKENGKNIIKIRTIKISDGENSIFLRLNNNETKVDLIINDGRTDEFIVKNENGRLNIYSQDVIEIKPDFLVANGKHTINTQFEKRE